MQGIIESFASNPEAVATLVVFALGGAVSTVVLLYSIFANYPLIARVLENRSLVYVDSALRERVQVAFSHREGTASVEELRQIDLEIFNSDPRRRAEDCTVTVNLCSPSVTVLGVTAANSDGRIPRLGGRRIVTCVETVPIHPTDPLLGAMSEELFPAVVVKIPYLERVLRKDRVLLRITYDGPHLEPEIQGAASTSSRQYRSRQLRIAFTCVVGSLALGLVFMVISYQQASVPLIDPRLSHSPYHVISLLLLGACMLTLIAVTFAGRWMRRWLRPLPNPFIPPPLEVGSLAHLHFYDTME